MQKLLTPLFALALTACATAQETGYTVKLNGVETNTEKTEQPDYLVPALLIGGALAAGIVLSQNKDKDKPNASDNRAEQYQLCLASGTPASECQRLIYL